LPKSYLVEEDLENPEDDDDYVNVGASDNDDDDDGYEIAVEQPDGDGIVKIESNILRHTPSTSSLSTNGTGMLQRSRKKSSDGSPKASEKPAILPGGAAPFGLFGELSLKTPRPRGKSVEAEDEDKSPGIANMNFFRPSEDFHRFLSSCLTLSCIAPAPENIKDHLADFEHHMPQIITRGIISPKEAEQLFQV
jgi:hypothetical protein